MGRNKTIEDSEVLAAARAVFRKNGHAASTRDVAQAAGISQAVLFQRFGSKDELFFRAMTPDPPDLGTVLGPYPPDDVFQDLLATAERLISYLRSFMPTLLKVLAFPGLDAERLRSWHGQLPFLPIVDALAARFSRLAADGFIRDGDPRARAITFISTIHSLAFFEGMTTAAFRKKHRASVEEVLTVLWEGIAPGAESRQRGGQVRGSPRRRT